MTNTSSPKSTNLPELSAIPVPVDYSQPTGLALMLADMIVSSRKTASYLRQISTADFLSGTYSFPTPADYVAAPYQLPMLEPVTWNVVADIITAYQPVEVYQIGSSTDLMQATFPLIINPTDYANPANEDEPIKPLAVGQSVVIRVYKVASAGINWGGSNVVNNGLTDEAIKSLTQITMVVTNIAGAYVVTDWLGVDFVTNGMSNLKTSAKGNFTAVINELFDAITTKTATGKAGGDLTGDYPNPNIGNGKVTTAKIADGAVTVGKLAAGVKLPSPQAVTFTGGKTATYDGSEAVSVPVPYEWAQAETRPTYTAADVGALNKNNPVFDGTEISTSLWGGQTILYYYWPGVDTINLRVPSASPQDWQLRLTNVGNAYWGRETRDTGGNRVQNADGTLNLARVNASKGFYQTSDERLKEFIGDIPVNWTAIKALPKKYYYLKEDESKVKHIGTSAQELMKSYPEVVTEDADGMYSVDYAKLSIIALAAVSELEERISNLESKIKNYGSNVQNGDLRRL